jgi:hypothetical protein
VHRTLLVAALLVLAGCGGTTTGLGGDTGTPTRTATPAPVPTTADAYPPGLAADRVDAAALANATGRALRGRSYTFRYDRLEARPEFSLGAVYVGPGIRAVVDTPTHYRLENLQVTARGGGIAIETPGRARYVTGDRVVTRTGNGTVARDLRPSDRGVPTRTVTTVVGRYLAVENATVTTQPNGSVLIEGTGAGPRLANASEYSVEALVSAEGVPLRLDAVFARDGRVRFVHFTLTRGASLETPEWARNATV